MRLLASLLCTFALVTAAGWSAPAAGPPPGKLALQPLFRDPVYDGSVLPFIP